MHVPVVPGGDGDGVGEVQVADAVILAVSGHQTVAAVADGEARPVEPGTDDLQVERLVEEHRAQPLGRAGLDDAGDGREVGRAVGLEPGPAALHPARDELLLARARAVGGRRRHAAATRWAPERRPAERAPRAAS